MEGYTRTAVERAMKVHEVILRARAKKITWLQAAEVLGIHPRTMRRWKRKMDQHGVHSLVDQRARIPSPRRVPGAEIDRLRSAAFTMPSRRASRVPMRMRSMRGPGRPAGR